MLAKSLALLLTALPLGIAVYTRRQASGKVDHKAKLQVESSGKVIQAHTEYDDPNVGKDALARMGSPKADDHVTDDHIKDTKSAGLSQNALDGGVSDGQSGSKTEGFSGRPSPVSMPAPASPCEEMVHCLQHQFGADGSEFYSSCNKKYIECFNPSDSRERCDYVNRCMPPVSDLLAAMCPCTLVCDYWKLMHCNNFELTEETSMRQGRQNDSLSERHEAGAADWVSGAVRSLDSSVVGKCN